MKWNEMKKAYFIYTTCYKTFKLISDYRVCLVRLATVTDVGSNVTQLSILYCPDTGTAVKTHPTTPEKQGETLWTTRVSVTSLWHRGNKCISHNLLMKEELTNTSAGVLCTNISSASVTGLWARVTQGNTSFCTTLQGLLIALPRGSVGTRSAVVGAVLGSNVPWTTKVNPNSGSIFCYLSKPAMVMW